jgi:hypothetical protein
VSAYQVNFIWCGCVYNQVLTCLDQYICSILYLHDDECFLIDQGTREEPVIYMSARPFVLRDSAKPTQCVTSSENADNIEAIELRWLFALSTILIIFLARSPTDKWNLWRGATYVIQLSHFCRLKLDIIKESQKYDGLVLVHDETGATLMNTRFNFLLTTQTDLADYIFSLSRRWHFTYLDHSWRRKNNQGDVGRSQIWGL